MDVVRLLADAKKDGVKIEAIDRELRIEAAASKKHWLDKLRPHKAELLDILQGASTQIDDAAELEEPITTIAYQDFPTHTLPSPVGDYVRAAAKAIGCDESFIALPLLASLARAVGNKRVIRLKRTWTEPAIIWAAIVGNSGTHKTPAMQAATKFLDAKQKESIAAHLESLSGFEIEQAQYDRNLADWKRLKKTEEPPPWKPEEPACNRFTTTDATIEALAALLSVQFDGLLVTRDELAGWLNGIGEYKSGKGSDLGHWLAMWSAQSFTSDRKTGLVKMIHVPRAAVSLVGGIQPATLRAAIGQEHMANGLCARLLMAMPASKAVRWTDETVDQKTEAAITETFDRLLSLEPAADEHGEAEPFPLDLTPEAKTVWVAYFNRHRAELVDLDDDLAAAWSKLEAYAARFALIFQLCSWAAGDASGDAIDEQSMQSAIELSDWFGGEAKRVYGLFVETKEEIEQRELIGLIERKGGRLTARELQQGSRKYKKSVDAELSLDELVESDLGRWEIVPTPGRQRREFVLSTPSTSTQVPSFAVSEASVDVDTVDSPQNHQNGQAQEAPE